MDNEDKMCANGGKSKETRSKAIVVRIYLSADYSSTNHANLIFAKIRIDDPSSKSQLIPGGSELNTLKTRRHTFRYSQIGL